MTPGKTIAVMQPYLLPYLPYFQLIGAVDEFVILDDVNFINRGWINRNNILLGNRSHRITLQLHGASQNRLINEIQVGDNAGKLLGTLRHAYTRAPNFESAYPVLESTLVQDEKNLARYLATALKITCRSLGIDTPLVFSSDIEVSAGASGQRRILDICRRQGAQRYINPAGGRELYDRAEFSAAGIELFFLQGEPEPYPQYTGPFLPGLSVIDAMMFCTPAGMVQRLTQFRLE
ncbi:MAG TPA: hypothetical protein ENJ80_05835 [Gammaproteobacteria bacterium]|nr:hypothetical protein [Gammaproteobacteria bacterium]